MSETTSHDDHVQQQVDGRVARRERNRNAVLDVVLEMFAEDMLFRTIEQASTRSGLSLRSVYRYFAAPGELLDAAIKRNRDLSIGIARLSGIGQGRLDERVDTFTGMRVRLYEQVGAVYRATVHNAPHHPQIRDELSATRQSFRQQFELQFEPELTARKGAERHTVLDAGDVLTQLDSIDLLRRYRQLNVGDTQEVLRAGVAGILRS